MNKYENSKIYKIQCNKTGLMYIGSTTQKYLSSRLQQHIQYYKNYLNGSNKKSSNFQILENNDYYIEIIESISCNDKYELEKKEREYIQILDCVNKNIPTRSIAEWRHDNKDLIQQLNKKHHNIIINKPAYKIDCECGGTYDYFHKTKHFKTAKHKKYLLNE